MQSVKCEVGRGKWGSNWVFSFRNWKVGSKKWEVESKSGKVERKVESKKYPEPRAGSKKVFSTFHFSWESRNPDQYSDVGNPLFTCGFLTFPRNHMETLEKV